MSPGRIGQQTDVRDRLGQDRICAQRFLATQFTGIRFGTGRIAGRIDDKLRPQFPDIIEQHIKGGIINCLARQGNEGPSPSAHSGREGLADKAAGSQKQNHKSEGGDHILTR